jgi:uncharacterized membrane protein YdjX (TVP38/TMEM64 family)
MRKLAAAVVFAATALIGTLATPAGAATTCSSLLCYRYGPTSGTVWTNIGSLSGSVTLQSPLWAIVPPSPA